MKPYKQIKIGKLILRIFYKQENDNLYYKWHQDNCDRLCIFLPIGLWEFQFNNQLPNNIKLLQYQYIPKNKFHRLIQKCGILLCLILEK